MGIIGFYKKYIIIVILIATIIFIGCKVQGTKEKQINVIFRLDDYSARSSTDMELKIIDAFRKNKASVTLGVIPFICDCDIHDPSPNKDVIALPSSKGEILRTGLKEGILDIALHGYSHQTMNTKPSTEFSGLDYNQQLIKIAKGKKFLEDMIDTPVITFVPPWNSYDTNTLKVLEELGFSTLSAGQFGDALGDSKLIFLPCSCSLFNVRDAVNAARISSDAQPIIVVLFHEYNFKEIDLKRGTITYPEFCVLLDWVKSQENVHLLSISQATKKIGDLSANRYLQVQRDYLLSEILPIQLREDGSNKYLYEYPVLAIPLLKVMCFYLVIIIFGATIFFNIGKLFFQKYAFLMNIIMLGSIILSTIFLIYTLSGKHLALRRMVFTAGAIGVSIGFCLCSIDHRKKEASDENSTRKKNYA